MAELKILHTFKSAVKLHLSRDQVHEAAKLLNMHYIGTEYCNYKNERGELVSIEHENYENLCKSHRNMNRTASYNVLVDLYEDGSLGNMRSEDDVFLNTFYNDLASSQVRLDPEAERVFFENMDDFYA